MRHGKCQIQILRLATEFVCPDTYFLYYMKVFLQSNPSARIDSFEDGQYILIRTVLCNQLVTDIVNKKKNLI